MIRVSILFVVAVLLTGTSSMVQAQNSATGLALWNSNSCSGCHALSLVQSRIIARAPTGLTYPKSLAALDAALTGTSLNGTATGMQGFAAALNAQNRSDLAAYIANLAAPAPAVTYSPTGGPQFPATAVGATASQTATITNTGTAPLTFATNNAVTIASGGDAADFRVTSSTCPGVTLQAGSGNCTINVTFQPTAGASTTRTASIGLSHNANNGSSLVPMLGIVGSGTTTPPATTPPTGSANPPSSGGGGALNWQWLGLLLLLTIVGTRRRLTVR